MQGVLYALVTHMFVSFMLGIVFFVAWRTIERRPYTLTWSILFFAAVLKAVFNVYSDLFPSREFYWLFVNAMSLWLQALGLIGHRQRRELVACPLWLILYLVAVELAVAWFTIVDPHVGLNMFFIPMSGLVTMLMAGYVIASVDRKLRAAEISTIVIYVLFGISQGVAGVIALMQGATADEYYLDLYRQVNFLVHPGAFAGLGMFTILILADDLSERQRKLAVTDQLTGVYNRRGFEEMSEKVFSLSRRNDFDVSVAVADIDHFKSINDRFGHSKGDEALVSFAETLRQAVRDEDIIGRVGGEEFVIILPNTGLEKAHVVIERIRKIVEDNPVDPTGVNISMTSSFGLAKVDPSQENINDAIEHADKALYLAKDSGRNRVEVFGEHVESTT